jgi:hypothetical protein
VSKYSTIRVGLSLIVLIFDVADCPKKAYLGVNAQGRWL